MICSVALGVLISALWSLYVLKEYSDTVIPANLALAAFMWWLAYTLYVQVQRYLKQHSNYTVLWSIVLYFVGAIVGEWLLFDVLRLKPAREMRGSSMRGGYGWKALFWLGWALPFLVSK